MTELNLTWLLLLPALGFAVGWLASRLDLRQVKREERDSPRAYYKGLNLLLNEQQDKAIDAFIEAVQNDPDTTELHFALGNLFRRRGEFERSVRVHQHLVSRGDLSREDRDRAQHALAQDYAKAGLFDRAEAAYRALLDSAFSVEAYRALLDLFERSREWEQAHEMALKLEAAGAGSYAVRISHYLCEQALECRLRRGATEPAAIEAVVHRLLERAHAAAPLAPRPLVMLGQWHAQQGGFQDALNTWSTLLTLPSAPLSLVAEDLVQAAVQGGSQDRESTHAQALRLLRQAYEAEGSLAVLLALNTLDPAGSEAALRAHLANHPSLSAVVALLKLHAQTPPTALIEHAIEHHARPLQRYRCAACGFESQRYFWQCPGCLSWDSYPAKQVEEL